MIYIVQKVAFGNLGKIMKGFSTRSAAEEYMKQIWSDDPRIGYTIVEIEFDYK
ncbi:MAG TPA: hypothetical protein VK190_02870 [Pseudoneobacillus sp.]|nr:hypothetical protein [Pseudoneobacillus sp.]